MNITTTILVPNQYYHIQPGIVGIYKGLFPENNHLWHTFITTNGCIVKLPYMVVNYVYY